MSNVWRALLGASASDSSLLKSGMPSDDLSEVNNLTFSSHFYLIMRARIVRWNCVIFDKSFATTSSSVSENSEREQGWEFLCAVHC